jgi:pimeloyl-ACP methyl ester carboxylesterase
MITNKTQGVCLMKFKTYLSIFAALALAMVVSIAAVNAQDKAATDPAPKPTIVLVHGAFADASGWGHVITRLEKAGYNVIAVQNALTSYADDVATTRRVIDAQKGQVVVVGHSYGGAVITGASVGATNIKALVYVAAFAPDSGEVVGALLEKYPSLIGKALRPDAAGYLYIDRSLFKDAFAADVPDEERNIMAATQKPINSTIFGNVFGTPGWKSFPNWYVVGTQDNAINPEMQRMFATRMKAKTTEVASSHVPFISQPDAVVKVIEEAATVK